MEVIIPYSVRGTPPKDYGAIVHVCMYSKTLCKGERDKKGRRPYYGRMKKTNEITKIQNREGNGGRGQGGTVVSEYISNNYFGIYETYPWWCAY